MTLAVRSNVEPTSLVATIRRAVSQVDTDLPLYDVQTIDQRLSASLAQPRLNLTLIGSFAVLALILAAVGTYGVTAYSAAQRFQEIGIRMALGAERRDILRLMFRHGLRLILAGIAIGTAVAFSLTRVMSSLLFGVSANDPVTYVAIAGVLTAVALAASFFPARRATKIDPLAALRCE
jgi:ABC-type antimicrobial peptide transport system permease subunit